MANYKAVHTIYRAGSKKDGRGNPVMEHIKAGTIISVSGDEEKELLAAGAILPEKAPQGVVSLSSATATIPRDRTAEGEKADADGADTSKVIDNTSDPAKAAQLALQADAGVNTTSVASEEEKDAAELRVRDDAQGTETDADEAPAKKKPGRPKGGGKAASDADLI